PVGMVDFYDIAPRDRHASVAILILPRYRNAGLATEMIGIATEFACKTVGLVSLAAFVHTDNTASYKAFRHNGYNEAGRLAGWHFSEGRLKDVFLMQYIST
ncbi:MAG: GNAT family N-acetyltransferase, partial [Muribaculaceae bacterium]|nr:GNAT family N-acetyltransferase [Muribaculaceae bacterium]